MTLEGEDEGMADPQEVSRSPPLAACARVKCAGCTAVLCLCVFVSLPCDAPRRPARRQPRALFDPGRRVLRRGIDCVTRTRQEEAGSWTEHVRHVRRRCTKRVAEARGREETRRRVGGRRSRVLLLATLSAFEC
eukprot:1043295-Rhodomonas_salina.3